MAFTGSCGTTLSEEAWIDIQERARIFGKQRLRRGGLYGEDLSATADDILQEAVFKIQSGERYWNGVLTDLPTYLLGAVRSLVSHELTRRRNVLDRRDELEFQITTHSSKTFGTSPQEYEYEQYDYVYKALKILEAKDPLLAKSFLRISRAIISQRMSTDREVENALSLKKGEVGRIRRRAERVVEAILNSHKETTR
ncbi:MAG: hypothetical protein QNJ20_18455 [Paracoccaceae bacterium]|nr:hypothetical protein [Paracoccaceae bacterium]